MVATVLYVRVLCVCSMAVSADALPYTVGTVMYLVYMYSRIYTASYVRYVLSYCTYHTVRTLYGRIDLQLTKDAPPQASTVNNTRNASMTYYFFYCFFPTVAVNTGTPTDMTIQYRCCFVVERFSFHRYILSEH